ncbi:hypothetical protein B551_0224905 [Cupriavidus sp. HPC(L)]|uniref:hypothetical protein n=1 Tax=Cupriavidus sp. HPC(L) TaxID=1217418 RepID=UPI0003BE3322|nr:hypothetical protein [Cupriavidus sp. HPC(L)]ESH86920.1 hypothetical protein B551_0224905 [Cupriavidus sp. HPC(L)]
MAIVLAAFALAACGTNKGSIGVSGTPDEADKLPGIWKMSPLRAGIANVVEFTRAGESRLYPYNCITMAQEVPEIGRYVVNRSARTIHIDEGDGVTQTLNIVFVTDAFLVLRQTVGDQQIYLEYEKGADLAPLCDPDERWEKDRLRRAPYVASDFVPDPTIPGRPGMDRYLGRWANEKGDVLIEVRRAADGSYQLNVDRSDDWTHLFNAVSWKGDEIHYTMFAHANRSDLFDHPAHKISVNGLLAPALDGASMEYAFFINGKKYESVLVRK